jgi:aspartate kinase
LGRGGSDYTATILARALNAAEIIIWTDVDGVMTADPYLVPDACTLHEISYAEAAELAYFGAKVLHPKTLRPLSDVKIPIWIRNSFAPEKTGTKIIRQSSQTSQGVKAVTAIPDVSLITVGGAGIFGIPDALVRVFTATANAGTNILLVSQSSSQNDICFAVNVTDTQRTVETLRCAFPIQSHDAVEHITVDSKVSIVAIVGEKMRGMPGIAGRAFSALGRNEINIIAIAQGASEYNISFVVAGDAMQQAVTILHSEFQLGQIDRELELAEVVS